MTDPESSTTRRIDAGAYTLLQQQLVSVRARLDRQVGQLIRLNRISDELLHTDEDTPSRSSSQKRSSTSWTWPSVRWIFGDDTEPVEFTVFGTPDSGWSTAGGQDQQRLSDNRRALGAGVAGPCCPDRSSWIPSSSRSRSATNPRALLIASNTTSMAGMYEPSATETLRDPHPHRRGSCPRTWPFWPTAG